MLNFVENLLENERDPRSLVLSFSNKFSTKFSIVSYSLKVPIFFIRRLGSGRVYQKEKKKVWVVIAQKAVTSFNKLHVTEWHFSK
jgi:hypothetical protein